MAPQLMDTLDRYTFSAIIQPIWALEQEGPKGLWHDISGLSFVKKCVAVPHQTMGFAVRWGQESDVSRNAVNVFSSAICRIAT